MTPVAWALTSLAATKERMKTRCYGRRNLRCHWSTLTWCGKRESMWTTSRSKHKVTSATKPKRRKSFPPIMGLEPQDSEPSKRGYQKVSFDWTEHKTYEDPDHHTSLQTLGRNTCSSVKERTEETGVHLNGEKDQMARMCSSAAWKLVDDLWFMSPKNRNQGGNACVIGMLLESESEAVTRTMVCSARSSCRKRISRMPWLPAKITFQQVCFDELLESHGHWLHASRRQTSSLCMTSSA